MASKAKQKSRARPRRKSRVNLDPLWDRINPHPMIGGHRWEIRPDRDPGGGALGNTDWDDRIIRIRGDLTGDELLYTVRHEILHAAYPDLREDAICRGEEALRSAGV